MTKIKKLKIGTDWRNEVEFALRFVALGFVVALLWIAVEGRV